MHWIPGNRNINCHNFSLHAFQHLIEYTDHLLPELLSIFISLVGIYQKFPEHLKCFHVNLCYLYLYKSNALYMCWKTNLNYWCHKQEFELLQIELWLPTIWWVLEFTFILSVTIPTGKFLFRMHNSIVFWNAKCGCFCLSFAACVCNYNTSIIQIERIHFIC